MAYYIDGAVNNKDQVAIARTVDNNVQILTQSELGDYKWMNLPITNTNDGPTYKYVSVFIHIKDTETFDNPSSFLLQNALTWNWLSFSYDSNKDIAVTDDSKKPTDYLYAKQYIYQPWYKPFAFFPGIDYKVSNNQELNNSSVYQFIPMVWYKPGFCVYPASSDDAIANHRLWVQKQNDTDDDDDDDDNNDDFDTQGWTSPKDCQMQYFYKICGAGNSCQTLCKGPCPNRNLECTWIKNQFVCNRESIFKNNWWTSMWVKILLLGIIIFVIVVILILIYNRVFPSDDNEKKDHKKKNKQKEH
jgi:hypothetical protein